LRALSALVQAQIGSTAELEEKTNSSTMLAWSPLVKIKTGTPGQLPFFCVHGGGGNVVEFKPLADRLPNDIPFYGLQAQGVDGRLPYMKTIEEMAQSYVTAIRSVDQAGPYRLAGYSGGGVIAFEMAQILSREGASIELLAMFDSLAPEESKSPVSGLQKLKLLRRMKRSALVAISRNRFVQWFGLADEQSQQTPLEIAGSKAMEAYFAAQSRYAPQPYPGSMLLFRASTAGWDFERAGQTLGWSELVRGGITVIPVNADHNNVFKPPAIAVIARELSARLESGRTIDVAGRGTAVLASGETSKTLEQSTP
jgi:thioesterase domain-containing protein